MNTGKKTLKSNELTSSDEDDELDTEFFTTVGKSDYTTGRFTNAKVLDIDQKFKEYVKKQWAGKKHHRKSTSPDPSRPNSRRSRRAQRGGSVNADTRTSALGSTVTHPPAFLNCNGTGTIKPTTGTITSLAYSNFN